MERFEKWTETYKQLSIAEQKGMLELSDLELLATAAYLTGKDTECFKMMERVHQDYLDRKNTKKAVRCAFWLGLMLMSTGERARGGGWIARGERLLNDHGSDCREKGLFFIPKALAALSNEDAAGAQSFFEQALKIGERFDDVDVTLLGRLGKGQALIQQGHIQKGLQLFDEVMVSLETEEVFPVVCGIVYCAVILTCRKVWDLNRCKEWTQALSRWCDSQPDLVPFRGQCLVRRAEIMQLHGEWPKAFEETQNACKLLTRPPGEPAAGEACYREAELYRLTGRFEKAEESYREAAKWGRRPQPGLALLRLAQGQTDAAETSIRNALLETKDSKARAELLPAVVAIMITARQMEEARTAAEELMEIAAHFDVPYLHAMSACALGSVLLAEGETRKALDYLHQASLRWKEMDLPYESAHTRELKGLAYRKLGDKDNADMEFSAAGWTFEQLGAKPDLERITRLLTKEQPQNTHGLSLRELQVLQKVADGKTNRSIAGELFISERTVDRHISNIFNKLRVNSRVEATAFAIKNKVLDKDL